VRRTPLKRTSSARRRRKPDVPPGFWERRREQLYGRAGGRCEVGGCQLQDTGMEAHHRRLRAQGPDHSLENLLATCPRHHRYIHDHPAHARMKGWMVSGYQNPIARPVVLWNDRTVALTHDGGYTLVDQDVS
jgi:hypothetical protein